ncbi:hypothetical protein GA0115251_106477 [Streptomyces sp. TverLS-915]|nr:hypothetical protein GA0115251_106477 [Streptomyces sp. TverLS-915]
MRAREGATGPRLVHLRVFVPGGGGVVGSAPPGYGARLPRGRFGHRIGTRDDQVLERAEAVLEVTRAALRALPAEGRSRDEAAGDLDASTGLLLTTARGVRVREGVGSDLARLSTIIDAAIGAAPGARTGCPNAKGRPHPGYGAPGTAWSG